MFGVKTAKMIHTYSEPFPFYTTTRFIFKLTTNLLGFKIYHQKGFGSKSYIIKLFFYIMWSHLYPMLYMRYLYYYSEIMRDFLTSKSTNPKIKRFSWRENLKQNQKVCIQYFNKSWASNNVFDTLFSIRKYKQIMCIIRSTIILSCSIVYHTVWVV